MESNMIKWRVGQKVSVSWKTKLLKKDKKNSYERMIGSNYICIREASEEHDGILLRVLGNAKASHIMFVCGQPFFKDESAGLLEGCAYSSYSTPALAELREALDILRSNPSLLDSFKEASMSINMRSLFWVNETARNILFMKKPLCYDPSTDSLCIASDPVAPCRLTMVYFNTQMQLVDFVTDMSDASMAVAGKAIHKTSGAKRIKWVLLAVISLAAAFFGGYMTGKYSNDQMDIDPAPVKKALAKENVHKAKKPVKEIVPDTQTIAKENIPDTQTTVKMDVALSQEKDPSALEQYEAKDNRVRLGAYRIVGTDYIVTVKTGDNMASISKKTLGPDMECYIEVYNDIKPGTPLKDGQTIKIPKLEIKKKK